MVRERRRRGRSAAWAALLAAALAAPAPAQEPDDLESILGGFEAEEEEHFEVDPDAREEIAPATPWWELTGSAEISGSFNYRAHESSTGSDYFGLQRLRNRLNLQLDLQPPEAWGWADRPGGDWEARIAGFVFYDAAYAINGRKDYTHDVRNAYELDLDVMDAWVRGRLLRDLDLKVGRQVVIWGRSETIRVLDVLNPIDNREPGRVDIEDLRRPVGMAKLDYYRGDWSLTAIAIPEIRFDESPPTGSDFSFDAPLGGPGGGAPAVVSLQESRPGDFEGDSWEFAGALTGIFRGWDVSFHGAWFWNDRPHVVNSSLPADQIPVPTPMGPASVGIRLDHARLWMLGAGGNYAIGSWLVKAELAYLDGLSFCDFDVTSLRCRGEEKSRIDAMLGLEYYGWSDQSVAVEVANRRILHFEPELRGPVDFAQRNSEEISVRYTADFWNDTLHLTALGLVLGWHAQDGSIVRLSLDYDLRDALVVGGGILLFQAGDAIPISAWGRNDRLFFSLKYSF